jgi:hypothetical protein
MAPQSPLRRRGPDVAGGLPSVPRDAFAPSSAWAIVASLASLSLDVGCAPIPDIIFSDPDASDATVAVSDAGDATSRDASLILDASPSLPDATLLLDARPLPDVSPEDAADASPTDAGAIDSHDDALACLPAKAPSDAGCCYAVLPCVGLGCDHCSECIEQGCHTNQFCCATLNGQGGVQRVQCSGDGKNCP